MNNIKAIGFDLFNTLLTVGPSALHEAMKRLVLSLSQNGLRFQREVFIRAHREAALQFLEKARRNGKETHNRFWISAALHSQGHEVPPGDPRIALAVDAYFSAFFEYSQLIPGTKEMLRTLKADYPLGLLSNFTHAPAARQIIDRLKLTRYFDVILISGELGYRKPHPFVFRCLIEQLGLKNHEVLFVGDDPEPDILGSQSAGLKPIWFTYLRDREIAPAPDIAPRSVEELEDGVIRVSTWDALLSLFDGS